MDKCIDLNPGAMFTYRLISERMPWKNVTQMDVEAKSMDTFEAVIDRFVIIKGIRGYGVKAREWG